jgi:hypothetical protein
LATTETRLALDLGQKVEGDYRKVGSLWLGCRMYISAEKKAELP